MSEKLAIVTIDAGSDVEAKVLSSERVGTSSGKGTIAKAIRETDSLAYDSGCAYRSIALISMMAGLEATEPSFPGQLKEWAEGGIFGHSDRGLTLWGIDVDEKLLHGSDVSNRVASFGSSTAVRALTKHMKVQWLLSHGYKSPSPLIAFDGREMRQFVQEKVLGRDDIGASLLASFVMVVDPIEAAHRRMANRGEIVYGQKEWQVHPGLVKTHEELKRRALADEGRPVDRVGMPSEFALFREEKGALVLDQDVIRESEFEQALRERVPIVIDTTGVPIPEVNKTGLTVIKQALSISPEESHRDMSERIAL